MVLCFVTPSELGAHYAHLNGQLHRQADKATGRCAYAHLNRIKLVKCLMTASPYVKREIFVWLRNCYCSLLSR